MLKKTLLAAGLTALMAIQAPAQIYFGPQGGYYKSQDADEGALLGGAALRMKLGSALGIEGSINYRQEKYSGGALTAKGWPIMATGLLYPLPIVYAAVGFGWYNITMDWDQTKLPSFKDETIQEVGWHFGGGVELPLGPRVKLTGDVRYVFLDYEFKEVPGKDLKSNFTEFTAGLLFRL
jgi:opacity protein-like surface antigen